MVQIKDFASVFLHERFPHWKVNNKTYMIPPIFQPKQSPHEIGITDSVIYSDEGDIGEKIIYDRLKEFGDRRDVGMFVVNGFHLKDVVKWNKKIDKPKRHQYSVPELKLDTTKECDFIIFHHQLGIISLEVKNCTSSFEKTLKSIVIKAVEQLEVSHALIKASAKKIPIDNADTQNKDDAPKPSESEAADDFSIPYKKVIALPSTKKTSFNRDHHSSLTEDILLLFEDDSKDISSFHKWWHKAIESPAAMQMSKETQEDYERALSFILMIRHMGPVVEIEIIKEIHKSLLDYKYLKKDAYYPHITENRFPSFLSWCWDVLNEKDKRKTDKKETNEKEKDAKVVSAEQKKIRLPFLKRHNLSEKNLGKEKAMELLEKLLTNSKSKYFEGDECSPIDEAIFHFFENNYCLFFTHILAYLNKMRTACEEEKKQFSKGEKKEENGKENEEEAKEGEETREKVGREEDDVHTKFPFLKLETAKHFNELELHLSKFPFIKGDQQHEVDKQLFELLMSRLRLQRLVFTRRPVCSPIVMSSEQLAVFEGAKKQLIIGSPGSGKTELMKLKALELDNEMKSRKEEDKKKIMYILANGSCKYPKNRNSNSLFFYHMKKFFKRSSFVEVITIVMKNESPNNAENRKVIRKKIASREYEHAFVDECWIGSEPDEQEILLELVRGLPGYVWISSVFNYHGDAKKYPKVSNTELLKRALENENEDDERTVSYITQVMRGTNNIIELERAYSKVYQDRSHPYGTEKILGHSDEGVRVTWAVEESIDKMYDRCVDIVKRARTVAINSEIIKRAQLLLDDADILIVDFAIRMEASRDLKHKLLDRLTESGIDVWTLDESGLKQIEKSAEEQLKKTTLLQSCRRQVSEFIDGVEWPMVVVILPSKMVRKEAKLANDAEELRNYDPFISFFRSMVKLVVISDKWENMEQFLNDVKEHA